MDWFLIAVGWTDPSMWIAALEVALGLGFVIFVHELGHFAVAKMCGVKVEKFFIGFDIGGLKLAHFRWGETVYGIGILPLGGYVKMLGQDDNPAQMRKEMDRARQADAAAKGQDGGPSDAGNGAAEAAEDRPRYDPRSYLAKSVPKRLAIISAGVIMNLIFAWILAALAFPLGVRVHTTDVGSVMSGSAAWEAGIQPGDKILEVAGRKVRTFRRMTEEIVTGNIEDGVPLLIARPGVKEPLELVVKPKKVAGRPLIGVGSSAELSLRDEMNSLPYFPESAAAKADPPFVAGDRIVKINGESIESYTQLQNYLAANAAKELKVTVLRDKNKKPGSKPGKNTEEISIRVPATPIQQFGLAMKMGKIAALEVASPAAKAGVREGDLLKTIDGQPVGDPMTLPERFHAFAGKEVTLGLERDGKPVELKVSLPPGVKAVPSAMPNGSVTLAELGAAYMVLNSVEQVEKDSPGARAGLQPGDVLTSAKIIPPSKEELKALQDKYPDAEIGQKELEMKFSDTARDWPYFLDVLQTGNPGTTVLLKWQRGDKELSATVSPAPAKDWFESQRGWVLEPKLQRETASSFGEAASMGWEETTNSTLMVYRSLHSMGKGNISLRNLGGPWTIILAALQEARLGVGNLFLFLTLLSANLAVINFLPIPVLDGGHAVLLLYEGIRGKPADERVQEILTYAGLIFILALMIFVFGLDFGLIPRPGAH